MALDGEKLRKIRTSKGMSQEKLAILANVNKRTVQRAEKGEPIALETAAFIAEAIGVSPSTLRGAQMELFEADRKESEVVLVSVNSGRRIINTLQSSFEAIIEYDVEPTIDNIEPLSQLAKSLEPFKPDPWEVPHEKYDPEQAEVLQKQAETNEILPALAELGITVFIGSYTAARQIPMYDRDEGCMYIRSDHAVQGAKVSLLVISDSSVNHLILKPDDIYVEPDGLKDDIPF